jgi:predicted transcriptional regulator
VSARRPRSRRASAGRFGVVKHRRGYSQRRCLPFRGVGSDRVAVRAANNDWHEAAGAQQHMREWRRSRGRASPSVCRRPDPAELGAGPWGTQVLRRGIADPLGLVNHGAARPDGLGRSLALSGLATTCKEQTRVIDRIRHDIQERLDQVLAEVEKLRRALAALDPRGRPAATPRPARSVPAAKRPAPRATSSKATPARSRARAAGSANGSAASRRAASGETRARVLAALSSDRGLTAADVATVTGLARPSVSTTLSRLAKSGEVVKADRGYRLPSSGAVAPSTPDPATEGS